jgi:hypothetical protein
MSRRFQVLVALVLGAAVGAGIVSCTQQPSVQATAVKGDPAAPVQWEYKSVILGQEKTDVEKITEKLNAAATDGWEYTGSVAEGYVAVFRRIKK